eukprot:2278271-Pleurochrysis_carterae.AAC.1
MLPPSPRRGAPGPLWLPPSDLPSVCPLRSSLPCQKLLRGMLGGLNISVACPLAGDAIVCARSRVRAYVPVC